MPPENDYARIRHVSYEINAMASVFEGFPSGGLLSL